MKQYTISYTFSTANGGGISHTKVITKKKRLTKDNISDILMNKHKEYIKVNIKSCELVGNIIKDNFILRIYVREKVIDRWGDFKILKNVEINTDTLSKLKNLNEENCDYYFHIKNTKTKLEFEYTSKEIETFLNYLKYLIAN